MKIEFGMHIFGLATAAASFPFHLFLLLLLLTARNPFVVVVFYLARSLPSFLPFLWLAGWLVQSVWLFGCIERN